MFSVSRQPIDGPDFCGGGIRWLCAFLSSTVPTFLGSAGDRTPPRLPSVARTRNGVLLLSQDVVKKGEGAASSATTQAEGALAATQSGVTAAEGKIEEVMAKLPSGGGEAGGASAGAGEDGTRALPGGDATTAAAADPYAQDPEDKKMFGTCKVPKVPDSCAIC